jgi:hypothetical protein
MLQKLSTLLTIGALVFAIGTTSAVANNLEGQHLGSSASTQWIDRQIELHPGDKYLNVTRGETVMIKASGKSFAWKFDTLGTPTFDLKEIAPKDFNIQSVRVYVGQNPAQNSD